MVRVVKCLGATGFTLSVTFLLPYLLPLHPDFHTASSGSTEIWIKQTKNRIFQSLVGMYVLDSSLLVITSERCKDQPKISHLDFSAET